MEEIPSRPVEGITRRRLLKVMAGGAAACSVGAAYAFGIEPTWLRTVEQEVRVRGLDPAFQGYSIGQLSDLHVGAGVPLPYLRGAVQRLNAAAPDVIAVTGDIVHEGGSVEEARTAAGVLAGLRAPDGVYAVLGNHDLGVFSRHEREQPGTRAQIVDALHAVGIRVLENEEKILSRGTARLRLIGLDDYWAGRHDPDAVGQPSPGAPRVVLCHNPDAAPHLAERDVDLLLSGHTHGGQVSIPFLGPPILPVENREYVAGLYRLGETDLYVNRGVGWLRRVRLFVRPEVTLLRLQPRAV